MRTLAAALMMARAEMPALVPDGANPHFKSTYPTLANVLAVVTEPLARHGIVSLQTTTGAPDGATVTVTTKLLHVETGEELVSSLTLPVKSAQDAGSAVTYLRRYELVTLCGLAPQDDDGHEASQPAKQVSRNGATHKPPTASNGNGHGHASAAESDAEWAGIPAAEPVAPSLKKFHALGTAIYGRKWDQVQARNVGRITDGKTTSSKDLTPDQIRQLVTGMETVLRAKRSQAKEVLNGTAA